MNSQSATIQIETIALIFFGAIDDDVQGMQGINIHVCFASGNKNLKCNHSN